MLWKINDHLINKVKTKEERKQEVYLKLNTLL